MERTFSAERMRVTAPLAGLTSKPAFLFEETGGKTIKGRGNLEEPRCSPLLECLLSSPAVWRDEFPSAPCTEVWGRYKTQNNFQSVHGQVAAGCCSTCILDLMGSSPFSCCPSTAARLGSARISRFRLSSGRLGSVPFGSVHLGLAQPGSAELGLV